MHEFGNFYMGELKYFKFLLIHGSKLAHTNLIFRWDKKTGHNAPLRARPNEDENNKVLNDEFAINYLIQLGAIPEKTNLGIPLYGRAFLLKNKDNNDIGDEARETSFSGPITREQGFLGYNEICKMLSAPGSQWSLVWEKCHQVPYMFNQDKWVGYDNERSIRLKADFAWEKQLGGVMVWSIETDDFKGFCGPHKFPLMRALNNELVRKTKSLETYDQDVEKCSIENYSTERTIVTLAPPTTTTTTALPVTSSGSSENLSSEEEDDDGSGSGDDDYDEDEEEEDVGPCHHNPNGPNPDPTECSQFFLCAGGKAHLMTCRDGTLYSAALMTCDHAANVECEVKKTTTRRTTAATTTRGLVFLSTTTSEKTTTIVTLSTVTKLTTKSTSTTVTTTKSTTIQVTSPSTTTVSATTTTKKYERQTEIVPIRINPVKEEDIIPLLPVDNDINDDKIDTRFSSDYTPHNRPHHGKSPVNYDVNNNLDHHSEDHSYQFSKSMESSDVNQNVEEEEVMAGEKVAIIILVLILLVVILVFMWCFRSRIRDLTETYLDKLSTDRIRKPSTVSLLKAYQLNKIKFPSYSGKMEDSRVHPTTTTTPGQAPQQPPLPKLPPKDYSSRDLPPLPLNERAPIAPPRRKKSFSEGSFSENLYESPNLAQNSSPSPNGTSLTLT